MRSKKIIIGCIILILVLVLIAIFVYPFIKRMQHEKREREKMAIAFSIRLPLIIDEMSYFRIPCAINDDSLLLIVDTKAQSLLKEEDIEKYNGSYFGKLPISMENAYKAKEEIRMYEFNGFSIQGHSFGNPIFQKISKSNLIYDFLGDGVLGINILSLCHWKFSIDEREVHLYGRKDSATIMSETNGYTKIPYGLRDNQIRLILTNLDQPQNFTLDLGFDGEIEINNLIADSLMKTGSFKTIETLRRDGSKGIIHLFEHQKVEWNGVIIDNCQLVNIPDVDGNYIGAELMRRFNFILAYGDYIGHDKQDHLYIHPIQGFDSLQSKPFISKFGFNIKEKEGATIISAIEKGGVAQKQGLTLGTKIISIDHDTLDAHQVGNYVYGKDRLIITTPSNEHLLSGE